MATITQPTDLAVIIPHYNDVARLERCLAALMVQDLTGTEVVVVDNGSTEDMTAVLAAHPHLRFITESGKGAALARNRGVAETTAPNLAFLDADCVPAADWVAAARHMAHQTADIFGGRIDVFDETPAPRSGAEAFETVFAFDWRGYVENKGFTVTANMVTRRDVFLATGPFINGVSEDLDWCQRARAKGYRLTTAEALRVGHPSRSDWPALEKKWRRTTREAFMLKGEKARGKWVIRALAMPLSAVAHLPKLMLHDQLNWQDKIRGAGTLIRLRCLRMAWMLRQAAGRTI